MIAVTLNFHNFTQFSIQSCRLSCWGPPPPQPMDFTGMDQPPPSQPPSGGAGGYGGGGGNVPVYSPP